MSDLEDVKIGLRIAQDRRRELDEFLADCPPERRPLLGPVEVEAKDGRIIIHERVMMPATAQFITLDLKP